MGLDFPGVQSDITGQPSAGAAESPKPKDEPVLKEAPDHHDAFRQTSGYWEMVYGMARHGIIQPDFLVENNGEGLVLYARIEPYLEAFRQATWSGSFRNAEWVSTHCASGQMLMERYRARVKRVLESRR